MTLDSSTRMIHLRHLVTPMLYHLPGLLMLSALASAGYLLPSTG